MARRELVDGYISGRLGQREFVTRLVATGMTIAAAVAFALSLAGSAHAAPQAHAKQARAALELPVCASDADFYGNVIEIVRCPEFLAEIGGVTIFDFSHTGLGSVTYNLDFQELEGGDWWKPASHNLVLNGLAPGEHTIRFSTPGVFGPLVAWYTWYKPGAAPENVSIVHFGPSNSKATITWTTQIPAWRTYCSVNGAPEVICRQAGLTLNGLPAGFNTITIRATNGPTDPGRQATIGFDRGDIEGTQFIAEDGPWGYFPAS